MDSDSSSSASHETLVRQQSRDAPVPAPRHVTLPDMSRKLTEDDVVDRILLQNRNDRMYELRRIQHGEKPVTGTDTIERLEKLIAEEDEATQQERRPQAVLVEVHDLTQTRPVHALLQSAAFRQRLEGIVRGSISSAHRSASNSRLSRIASRVDAAEVQSVMSSSSSSSLSALGAAAPRPCPRRRPTSSRFAAELTSRLESGLLRQVHAQPSVQPASLPMPAVPDAQQNVSGWLESLNRQPANREVHVWGTLEEAHREEMVFEISELVHRQLVTSTLDSEFRNRLETQMRVRQETIGADGRRVASLINNLPRGQVLRNDFSHLGLERTPAHVQDDADSLSFVSAAAVPISHTNAVMSREISSLKYQLKEMKQMMKLTFDLQLDLQRSIRQEVAAALVSATPSAAATSTPIRSTPVDDSQCVICVDEKADSVLYQCGHLCLCYACGMRLQQRGLNCPVCRAPIKDIIRAYRTNLE